jgi:3-phenylpropionate/trans-cinnamate dioxygenase ferredoxin reductase component
MKSARIVIVGAGEAGARAAIDLRARGHVGPLTLVGAEVHAPYERPPLSKAVIVGAAPPSLPSIADAVALADHGVERLAGVSVVDIDRAARTATLSDGRTLAYDVLVLATGARPRKLALPGAEAAITLRNYEDSLALRANFAPGRKIAIVGGGFIGLELAASATALGCAVTIVEAAPRILMRVVPRRIADIVAARHWQAGVEIMTDVGIAHMEQADGGTIVSLVDGRVIAADCVVAGIGAIPETSLAAAAGLQIDNGVAVDSQLRSSDPNIYAIGDCASFPHLLYNGRRIRLEAWRNALDQGTFVAGSIMGEPGDYQAIPWFWSDQYDLCLQIAGIADEGPDTVERDLGDGALMLFHLNSDGRLAAASAIGPLGKIAKEIRLAEMLIARRAEPATADLASPSVKLKSLLSA